MTRRRQKLSPPKDIHSSPTGTEKPLIPREVSNRARISRTIKLASRFLGRSPRGSKATTRDPMHNSVGKFGSRRRALLPGKHGKLTPCDEETFYTMITGIHCRRPLRSLLAFFNCGEYSDRRSDRELRTSGSCVWLLAEWRNWPERSEKPDHSTRKRLSTRRIFFCPFQKGQNIRHYVHREKKSFSSTG